MRLALLVSVAVHALLLSIPIDGDVFGLPGLRMPWEERRLTASDLQVVLAPVPVATPVPVPDPVPAPVPVPVSAAAPQPAAKAEQQFVVSQAPAPAEPAPSPPAPAVVKPPVVTSDPSTALQADAARRAQIEADASARIIALENDRRDQAIRNERQRDMVAQREAAQAAAEHLEQAKLAQLAAAEQQRQADLVAQEQAQAQAQAREQAGREQAAREEQARAEAAQREAARIDAERQAQAKLAQQEAARQEAARQEAARQAQAQAQAQSQAQAQQAPVVPAMSAQEAQREERLRAIGMQMKQEAAQRDAAPPVSGLRRGWLVGRADPNTELIKYAEAMGRKIELNMTIDTIRDAARQPHRQPVVTVAVRSDGSVERVTFVTSSGVPAIDEAVRQIIASQAPFGPFPPALARQYDVVEIRRTWIFDVAVRLE